MSIMNTVSEGALSASRILRTAPVECGFGHCGAKVDCTGSCKLKDAIVGLPVISPRFLDEQIAASKRLPIDVVLPDDPAPDWLVADAASLKRVFKSVAAGLVIVAVVFVFLAA